MHITIKSKITHNLKRRNVVTFMRHNLSHDLNVTNKSLKTLHHGYLDTLLPQNETQKSHAFVYENQLIQGRLSS
jgi:predicted oxidoreductase